MASMLRPSLGAANQDSKYGCGLQMNIWLLVWRCLNWRIAHLLKEEDGPGPKGSRQNFFRFLDIRLIYKLGNRTDKAGQEMPRYSAKYQAFLSMEVLPPFQAPTQHRPTSPGPSTHSRGQRGLSGVWAMPERIWGTGRTAQASPHKLNCFKRGQGAPSLRRDQEDWQNRQLPPSETRGLPPQWRQTRASLLPIPRGTLFEQVCPHA